MHKFTLATALMVLLAFFVSPGLAGSAETGMQPLPARTATPRDFDNLAPTGSLDPAGVSCDVGVLMDARTGQVLFEKNADKRVFPASTTKIMTCLLALERGVLSDEITASKTAARKSLPSDASNIDLQEGEVMTLEELIYGLMIKSGNDAAIAIAEYISGSLDEFLVLMNERAAQLGMVSTHYTNPHGLHSDEHYTTGRDMAILTYEAMKNPLFRQYFGVYQYNMRSTNKHSESRKWLNTNKLINPSNDEPYSYVFATGGKTGYTNPARGCLVSTAKNGGVELISVNLGDDQSTKWSTCITMFEYGFEFYDTVDLRDILVNQTMTVTVPNAALDDPGQGELELYVVPQNAKYITARKDEIETILQGEAGRFTTQAAYHNNLQAPINRDEEVGTLSYMDGDETVLVCSLLASRQVQPQPQPTQQANQPTQTAGGEAQPTQSAAAAQNPGRGLRQGIIYGLIAIIVLAMAVLIIRMINLRKRSSAPHGRRGTRGQRRM